MASHPRPHGFWIVREDGRGGGRGGAGGDEEGVALDLSPRCRPAPPRSHRTPPYALTEFPWLLACRGGTMRAAVTSLSQCNIRYSRLDNYIF